MTNFLILFAGVSGGGLVIWGMLFSIFEKGVSGPNREEERKYTWIGRIIGLLIAALIVYNL